MLINPLSHSIRVIFNFFSSCVREECWRIQSQRCRVPGLLFNGTGRQQPHKELWQCGKHFTKELMTKWTLKGSATQQQDERTRLHSMQDRNKETKVSMSREVQGKKDHWCWGGKNGMRCPDRVHRENRLREGRHVLCSLCIAWDQASECT